MNAFEQKFFDKVHPEPMTGCWLWSGATTTMGYGVMSVGNFLDGTLIKKYAHRFSWEFHNGEMLPSSDHVVCHTCDMPCCVNPDHLFVGTRTDNNKDMARKKRSAWGTRNPRAVLTEKTAAEVKRLLLIGDMTQQEIADEYGTSREVISAIKQGLNWRYVAPAPEQELR